MSTAQLPDLRTLAVELQSLGVRSLRVILAWSAHLFTASGVLCVFFAAMLRTST